MSSGLDCGTGNFIIADNAGVRLQRNAFLSVDRATTTTKQLKRMKVPYIEIGGKLHIVGKKAFEYAQIFGTKDLKRPMANGLLNPTEQDAFPILRHIIGGLLDRTDGQTDKEGARIVYSVPGKPIDQDREIEFHEDVLKQIIDSFGYDSRSLNEAVALGTVGLVDNGLTGIAISMGAGMMNVAIMYAGLSALQFSVTKGGDWIDEQVFKDTGTAIVRAQYIKETGDYSIAPSEKRVTREQQAIKTYYGVLIRYLLANIAKQFESQKMPAFPNAVPVVVGGGVSMVPGFIEVFREQFIQKEFPLQISDIRVVDEPLTAVARGCYLEAQLEED